MYRSHENVACRINLKLAIHIGHSGHFENFGIFPRKNLQKGYFRKTASFKPTAWPTKRIPPWWRILLYDKVVDYGSTTLLKKFHHKCFPKTARINRNINAKMLYLRNQNLDLTTVKWSLKIQFPCLLKIRDQTYENGNKNYI